jgi:hypothetical protein
VELLAEVSTAVPVVGVEAVRPEGRSQQRPQWFTAKTPATVQRLAVDKFLSRAADALLPWRSQIWPAKLPLMHRCME